MCYLAPPWFMVGRITDECNMLENEMQNKEGLIWKITTLTTASKCSSGMITQPVPGRCMDKSSMNMRYIEWTVSNEMHPSWQQSTAECRVVMSENDQRFMKGKQGSTTTCCLGQLPLSRLRGLKKKQLAHQSKSWVDETQVIASSQDTVERKQLESKCCFNAEKPVHWDFSPVWIMMNNNKHLLWKYWHYELLLTSSDSN